MEIALHPDNIDDWNPAVDEGMQPPVPEAPNADGIVTPVINLVQAQAGNGTVYIRVIIIDPADDSLTPVVRYRVQDIGSGVVGAWVEQQFPDAPPSGGFINLNTNPVPTDQVLDVEAAFIGSNDSYSDWSPITSVTSTSDPTPPGVVTAVSVAGGSGQATFNWTAPNSQNYAGARLYWNTVNNFATATAVSPPEYGAPGAADARLVTGISAGTRYGWVVAINRSGIAATEVATGAFTVS
jgi:hypothetical protein